jgi:hypothetical protein
MPFAAAAFTPSSPAFALGFEAWDYSTAGRLRN